MRLVGKSDVGFGRSGMLPQRNSHAAPSAPRNESRALVALTAEPHPQPAPLYRDAAFLAQLIANKDQHPQTRERRRAEPETAIAAYNAAAALTARLIFVKFESSRQRGLHRVQ